LKVLLDTCTFLWICEGSSELSEESRALHSDPANEVHLSAVSAWEIAVKYALGRLALPEPPASWVPRQRQRHLIAALSVDEAAVLTLPLLPELHRDPFDRMLVCQAIVGGMTIVTPDSAIRAYPVPTRW